MIGYNTKFGVLSLTQTTNTDQNKKVRAVDFKISGWICHAKTILQLHNQLWCLLETWTRDLNYKWNIITPKKLAMTEKKSAMFSFPVFPGFGASWKPAFCKTF